MSNFWRVYEDPSYDELEEAAWDAEFGDEDWEDTQVNVDIDLDNIQSEKVFNRIVEELSPFQTVNS